MRHFESIKSVFECMRTKQSEKESQRVKETGIESEIEWNKQKITLTHINTHTHKSMKVISIVRNDSGFYNFRKYEHPPEFAVKIICACR